MIRRLFRGLQAPARRACDPTSDAQEIVEHVASLRAIPEHELPDADARAALIALAEAGHEVYAYTPVASAAHTIWLRPEFSWQDGRMTCAEWIDRYHATQGGQH